MTARIYPQSYRSPVSFNKKEYILYIVNIGRREFENVTSSGKDSKIMKANLTGSREGAEAQLKVYSFDEAPISDTC